MAEGLAIIGALAACLQLAGGFSELGKAIVAASRGVRYVPEFILELKVNAELFTICLRKLVRAAKKAYGDNEESTEARETARAMSIIRSQGRKLKSKIYGLVEQVRGRQLTSTFSEWFSKLRVLFKQTGVQNLQNSLNRLTSTTGALGSGILLDTLCARIKNLEDENVPVPEDLREEVSLLREDVQAYRSIAKDLGNRLKIQIEDSSSRDSLSQDMAEMLDASEKLDRCVDRTVSRVAPELVATRRRKRKARSSRPLTSVRESYSSSYHTSSRSTPPTSPPSAGHGQKAQSRGIREFPRTRSITPASQIVPPLFNVPERWEEGIHDSSNRVENNAPGNRVQGEEEAILEVSPLSTIGHVIIMNENNEVEEQHREWHPDAGMLRDAEEINLRPTILDGEEVATESKEPVQPATTDDIHTSGSLETGFAESSKYSRRHSRPQIVREGSIQSLDRTNNPSSSQSPHRPRARRNNRNSESVNIFLPPESEQRQEDPGVVRGQRYRPLAPFDRNDRRKGGKWPAGP